MNRFVVKVYRSDGPETRRFHRWILRRRWRYTIVYAGVPDAISFHRDLNQVSNCEIVVRDEAVMLHLRQPAA